MFEHGGHQAIADYTGALEFSAAFNKPFANFIGRVTAFGQVGYLYASAVVNAIASGGGLDGWWRAPRTSSSKRSSRAKP